MIPTWANRWALPLAEGFIELWQGLGTLASPWRCLACGDEVAEAPPRLTPQLPLEDRLVQRRQARVSRVLCPVCRGRLPLMSPSHVPHPPLDNPVGFKLVAGLVGMPGGLGLGALGWATAVYTFRQGGGVQRLIHALKYGGQPRACRALGYVMAGHLHRQRFAISEGSLGLLALDRVTFVPADPARERKRGYNQAEWLARGVAESLSLPCGPLLVKHRTRQSQTRLGRAGRLENLSGAFGLSRRGHTEALEERHVLLVDDLVTTGATLAQAATPLLAAGARVSVFALATVP